MQTDMECFAQERARLRANKIFAFDRCSGDRQEQKRSVVAESLGTPVQRNIHRDSRRPLIW
jgi:hypothetical protein